MVYESELNVGQEFANPYEESKVEAEEMVRSAKFLKSLTVYRPAIIVGDQHGGDVSAVIGGDEAEIGSIRRADLIRVRVAILGDVPDVRKRIIRAGISDDCCQLNRCAFIDRADRLPVDRHARIDVIDGD